MPCAAQGWGERTAIASVIDYVDVTPATPAPTKASTVAAISSSGDSIRISATHKPIEALPVFGIKRRHLRRPMEISVTVPIV
jgi:hypothetical protein